MVKNLPANAGTRVRSLGWGDPTGHMAAKPAQRLSLRSTAQEPQLRGPRAATA